MAVKGSIQIPKIIRTIERSIIEAYGYIGNDSVQKLCIEEAESDTTGRLRDSFSWATSNGKTGGGGSQALPDDIVEAPTEPLSMHIGTQAPYAVAVDMGTVDNFQYGKNGAPSDFQSLKAAIKEWIDVKLLQGKIEIDEGVSTWAVAHRIAKSLEENGSDAHPFWEASIQYVTEIAGKQIRKTISENLSKIPNVDNYIGGVK
jgi:hypothetical protein